MELIEDWRKVLRKAWSIRLIILAAILNGAEVCVSIWHPKGIPNGVFASMAGAISIAAFLARFAAQKEMKNG